VGATERKRETTLEVVRRQQKMSVKEVVEDAILGDVPHLFSWSSILTHDVADSASSLDGKIFC